MIKAYIKDLAVYLPEKILSDKDIESQIRVNGSHLQEGTLHKLFGSKNRHIAEKSMQVSDLAAEAGKIIIDRIDEKIDLLIFAAASSDMIEPATSNIVQQKLGITCPVMDIKNACNSVTAAIQAASAYISSGMYNNVLIVNGEKLSEVINFNPKDKEHLKRCLAGYSLGDAGTAVLISSKNGSLIEFQSSNSWGEFWELCTVAGGGSRSFRNPESYYFEGNTAGLSEMFFDNALPFIIEEIEKSPWKIEDIDCLITHQVSKEMVDFTANVLGVPTEKCINVFEQYGNTAAASIPLAIDYAIKHQKLKKKDKLMIVGLAAGISVSVQLITW